MPSFQRAKEEKYPLKQSEGDPSTVFEMTENYNTAHIINYLANPND